MNGRHEKTTRERRRDSVQNRLDPPGMADDVDLTPEQHETYSQAPDPLSHIPPDSSWNREIELNEAAKVNSPLELSSRHSETSSSPIHQSSSCGSCSQVDSSSLSHMSGVSQVSDISQVSVISCPSCFSPTLRTDTSPVPILERFSTQTVLSSPLISKSSLSDVATQDNGTQDNVTQDNPTEYNALTRCDQRAISDAMLKFGVTEETFAPDQSPLSTPASSTLGCTGPYSSHQNGIKSTESSPKTRSGPPSPILKPNTWGSLVHTLSRESSSSSTEGILGQIVQLDKHRCWTCSAKLGMIPIFCACGYSFCGRHRLSTKHHCPFDYRGEAKKSLAVSNPAVKTAKLVRMDSF